MHSHTYTYVELEVSASAYDEIAQKLRAADYGHVFGKRGEIDMAGIALTRQKDSPEITEAVRQDVRQVWSEPVVNVWDEVAKEAF